MIRPALASLVLLAAIGCARPATRPDASPMLQGQVAHRYVIVVENRTTAPVLLHYMPGPGGGAPQVIDMIGPAQTKRVPYPKLNGPGGGTFSAQTDDGKTANSVSIRIETERVRKS